MNKTIKIKLGGLKLITEIIINQEFLWFYCFE